MLNQIKIVHRTFYLGLLGFIYLSLKSPVVYGAESSVSYTVDNPLGPSIDTLPELVALVLSAVVQIGVPVVALGIIYSGFLFVKAQGNPAELKTAKEAFYWTIIGAMIVLGAFVILGIIEGTVEQLK